MNTLDGTNRSTSTRKSIKILDVISLVAQVEVLTTRTVFAFFARLVVNSLLGRSPITRCVKKKIPIELKTIPLYSIVDSIYRKRKAQLLH